MKRVLIPYFTAGNGHLMFARSIAQHLQELQPDWEIRLVDAGVELPDHGMHRLFVEQWKSILALPGFIKHAVFALEPAFAIITQRITLRTIRKSIADASQILSDWKPDLILSTHWGTGHLFGHARRLLGIPSHQLPLWYLFTEFGRAYNLVNCQADRYFALSDWAKSDLERVGVAAENIGPMAMFVPPDLSGQLPDQREARLELGLDPQRFTVMFSMGGEGIGPVMGYLKAYRHLGKYAQFIVICGRNERLVHSIKTQLGDRPGAPVFRPLGYQKNLRLALAASDIVAGKAGTTSVMEAITLAKPLIVCRPGAPNESDNKKYLLQNGYGWQRRSFIAFASLVDSLANPDDAKGQAELASVQAALRARSASDGAADLARIIQTELLKRA